MSELNFKPQNPNPKPSPLSNPPPTPSPVPLTSRPQVDGDLYGTTVDSVVKLMESGRICVLRIDLEGVQQLKSSAINPASPKLQTLSPELLQPRSLPTPTPDFLQPITYNLAPDS